MDTQYKVQVLKRQHGQPASELSNWKTFYETENEFYTRNFAGGLVTSHMTDKSDMELHEGVKSNFMISVRILEIQTEKGKLKKINEYKVNPPWWSGNPETPPRGPEIYLRGTIDI